MADETLITEARAAEILDIHKVTLQVWRHEGRGPDFIKIGRNIRYRPSDVDRYIDTNTTRTV